MLVINVNQFIHKSILKMMAASVCFILPIAAMAKKNDSNSGLGFNECVMKALLNYPAIKEQLHLRLAEEHERQSSLAKGYSPKLSVNGSLNHQSLADSSYSEPQVGVSLAQPSTWGTSLRFDLGWAYQNAGRLTWRMEVAQALTGDLWANPLRFDIELQERKLLIRDLSEKQTRAEIRYQVAQRYFDLLLASEEKKLLQQSLERLEELKEAVNRLITAKLVAHADLIPISRQILQTQDLLLWQNKKLINLENELRLLIRLPLIKRVSAKTFRLQISEAEHQFDISHWQENSYQRRIMAIQIEGQKHQVRFDFFHSLPKIDMVFAYQRASMNGIESLGKSDMNEMSSFTGAIVLSFDELLFSRYHQYRASRQRLRALQHGLQKQCEQDLVTWRSIRQSIEGLIDRQRFLSEEENLAARQLKNERLLYKAGRSTVFVLLTYTDEYFKVKYRAIENKILKMKLYEQLRLFTMQSTAH